MFGWKLLTWVRGSDESSLGKIAVEVIATMGLIVSIHNICGMGFNCIGKEACPTRLYGTAIHPIAAGVVYVCLQCLCTCTTFCDTPLLPSTRWCRCWDRRCFTCLQYNSTAKHIFNRVTSDWTGKTSWERKAW